jgi:hypothetical protein
MQKTILSGLFLLLLHISFSQTPKYRVVSIPVERNTIDLRQPWVGGMNSPQFSSINLNNDSYKDLFVFDRVGDKVLTYLNNGAGNDSTFTYAPQYESLFPKDLNAWALIRDYNNDGTPDIFTHANTGTRVYKGTYEAGLLHFELVSSLLMYNDGIYNVNIWTTIADVPVFTDVNFDGDIDVLTYGIFGSSIEYYENQTKENEGDIHYNVDSFKYANVTLCWGNVQQNSISNSMILNVTCKGNLEAPSQASGARHSGNTIYSFDDGNDHDVDLLNGNIGYDNLMFLKNGGDSSYADIIQWDSLYPTCNTPIIMPTYPAAYGVDANNDNLEDLIIAPNPGLGGRDVKNVMLYKNVNNQLCNFQYQSDSFLVHELIDLGTDSKPVFFDFNGDGLQDIVVGNYGYFRPFQTYKATIAYYQNTGTATSPKFKMITEDYDSFSTYLLVGPHPAFADLDGDGKQDMLVGDSNGFLHFFKNTGGAVVNFSSMTTPQYFGIDVGQSSAPFVYDMNGDSLLDLVVGKKDGKISYYWNFGTKTNPLFHIDSVNKDFGNISVTQLGTSAGSSQPVVMKEGTALSLFVGSDKGVVFKYSVNPANLRAGNFTLIDSNFLKTDVGSKATISIADINNDGLLEYIVGNSRGGLLMYSDSIWNPELSLRVEPELPNNALLKIYPNPARDYFVCVAEDVDLSNAKVELYNILGARMNAEVKQANNKVVIGTTELSNGFYIVRVTQQGKTYSGKILIER